MYYSINVAKRYSRGFNPELYRHHFRTGEESLTSWEDTLELYKEFKEKFPTPEYQLTVSYYEVTGKDITDQAEKETTTDPYTHLVIGQCPDCMGINNHTDSCPRRFSGYCPACNGANLHKIDCPNLEILRRAKC